MVQYVSNKGSSVQLLLHRSFQTTRFLQVRTSTGDIMWLGMLVIVAGCAAAAQGAQGKCLFCLLLSPQLLAYYRSIKLTYGWKRCSFWCDE